MKILYEIENFVMTGTGILAVLYLTDIIKAGWMLNVVLVSAILFQLLFAVSELKKRRKIRSFLLILLSVFYIIFCFKINFM